MFGLKAAKKDFGDNSEASEVLHYLQALEDFKHMKDEQQAARYIEIYKFTLEHVPSHLLKSKEVIKCRKICIIKYAEFFDLGSSILGLGSPN